MSAVPLSTVGFAVVFFFLLVRKKRKVRKGRRFLNQNRVRRRRCVP